MKLHVPLREARNLLFGAEILRAVVIAFGDVRPNPAVYGRRRITTALQIFFATASLCLLIFLTRLFFQQDEWHSFGLTLGYGTEYLLLDKPFWWAILADRVGARFIMYALFSVFGLSAVPYGLFAGTLHVLNSYLLFRLAHALTQKRIIASLAALFFLLSSVSHQAYSWFGTMTGSVTAVTFTLFSAIFFLRFLKRRIVKDYVFSFVFLWVSFLFKETGFFLLLAYPLIWFFYTKQKTVKRFFIENTPWIAYGAVMGFFLLYVVITIPGERANYIAPGTSGFQSLLIRSVLYPLEGAFHTFLPAETVYGSARYLTMVIRPDLEPETSAFDSFYQTTFVEYGSLILGFLLLGGLLSLARKKFHLRPVLFFAAIMLYTSFAPYIVLDRFDAYLDSRYYYTPMIGSSLLFGAGIYLLSERWRRIAVAGASLLLVLHLYFLGSQLLIQYERSQERTSIIKQVERHVPELRQKTVFYVTGNTPGYYGIEELKVPFQSGFGHVLMVVYGQQGKLPVGFFREETLTDALGVGFLYDTLGQGYKEVDGRGFGYFYDERLLNEELGKELFDEEDVVALFYDIDTKTVLLPRFNINKRPEGAPVQ